LHLCSSYGPRAPPDLPSFPTRRSSDLRSSTAAPPPRRAAAASPRTSPPPSRRSRRRRARDLRLPRTASRSKPAPRPRRASRGARSEEHTSELQSQSNLVCRPLLEEKNQTSRVPQCGFDVGPLAVPETIPPTPDQELLTLTSGATNYTFLLQPV